VVRELESIPCRILSVSDVKVCSKTNKAFLIAERPYSNYEAKQFFFNSETVLSDFSFS
jgi:hypothetical protein